MSTQTKDTKQFTQNAQNKPQADMLDAQYKQIGISAICGAFEAVKHHERKDSGEQMS